MRNLAIVAGVVIVLLILFVMFAPEDRVNTAREAVRSITDRPAQLCLEFVRADLKDSASARLLTSKVDLAYENVVFMTYKAKNGYGGYVEGEISCKVKGDKVEKSTSSEEVLRRLKREIAALEERNARATRE